MPTERDALDETAEKASNLRAIFEILSYIHVDAARDNYKELAQRIEFALNHAEELIKAGRGTDATTSDGASGDIPPAVTIPDKVIGV